MSHCPSCDNPDCQGADHRSEIVIDEDEFRKIIFNIKQGLNSPSNPAAIALAKTYLITLEGYDVRKGLSEEETGTSPASPD